MNRIQNLIGVRFALALSGAPLASIGRDEEGQTLAEYALILALIAVAAVAALVFLGPIITNMFSTTGNSI